jgi:multidrug efflux pump subunit AcrB
MPRKCPLFCLALLVTAGCGRASPRTVIVVEASYPGANAQTVANTVAFPIEREIDGVENALFLRSRSTNDGRYLLTIAFASGTDPAIAQVLVQNRLALAQPRLPDLVVRTGLTAIKAPADVRLIVALTSPQKRFDDIWMSNYAASKLKDELARLEGVGAVTLLPQHDAAFRIWLDPEKLRAHELTAADIATAIGQQDIDVRNVPPVAAKDERIDIVPRGRLINAEEIQEVIVKNKEGGQLVRLRDVAWLERFGDRRDNFAELNGMDVVLLLVAPTVQAPPGKVRDAVRTRLAELAKQAPEGLRLEPAFDFTANVEKPGQRTVPEYLLLDAELPRRASPERTMATLRKCRDELARLDGVQDVLTLSDNPFDRAHGGPCILLRLSPPGERKVTRNEIAATIRTRLDKEIPDAITRLRFPLGAPPFLGWDYPVDLAIHGPEAPEVQKLAAKLAERLQQEKQLTDVWLDPACEPQPQLDVHVDRELAARRGVRIADIYEILQPHLRAADAREKIEQLKIRDDQGNMVPLATLVKVRETRGPAAVDRFDQRPMTAITANPAPGVALADARALCEKLAHEVREELRLPDDYRLGWLRDTSAK